MIYENCRRVLKACVDAGLIKTVPENVYGKDKDGNPVPIPAGELCIYRAHGLSKEYPEGWYTQPLEEAAQDLMQDRAGQRYLLETLHTQGIEVELIDEQRFHRETKEMLEFWSVVGSLPHL